MYAILGVGSVLAVATALAAKQHDERPGGRDDAYYRSRSIMMSAGITKSVDAIAHLDAKDNARLYLNGLAAQVANSLNDERVRALSSQDSERTIYNVMGTIARKLKALLYAVAKLRLLSDSELLEAVLKHPMRVGDSPEGVNGVDGTTKWLLGGMRAEIERRAYTDSRDADKLRSKLTTHPGLAPRAKNAVLYKILERIPTPHFAPRFPFEDALLALEHVDDRLVEYEATAADNHCVRCSDAVPTSIGDMHDFVVVTARNMNNDKISCKPL
jgi:hypothetical protein